MIYQFQHKKTGKIIDVVMPMKDYKPYRGEDGKDNNWERLYNLPQVNLGDTKMDPFDSNAFVRKTGHMKGTYGDLLDFSAEQSARREEKMGEDPLKKKYFEDYKKKRGGKKHLADRPKKIDKPKFSIEF